LAATSRGGGGYAATLGGGWPPHAGADESVNVPYDIRGRRLE
jgi:hypothetical protein